jgi:hypothetical protein
MFDWDKAQDLALGTWELRWLEVPLFIWILMFLVVVEWIRRRCRDGD